MFKDLARRLRECMLLHVNTIPGDWERSEGYRGALESEFGVLLEPTHSMAKREADALGAENNRLSAKKDCIMRECVRACLLKAEGNMVEREFIVRDDELVRLHESHVEITKECILKDRNEALLDKIEELSMSNTERETSDNERLVKRIKDSIRSVVRDTLYTDRLVYQSGDFTVETESCRKKRETIRLKEASVECERMHREIDEKVEKLRALASRRRKVGGGVKDLIFGPEVALLVERNTELGIGILFAEKERSAIFEGVIIDSELGLLRLEENIGKTKPCADDEIKRLWGVNASLEAYLGSLRIGGGRSDGDGPVGKWLNSNGAEAVISGAGGSVSRASAARMPTLSRAGDLP